MKQTAHVFHQGKETNFLEGRERVAEDEESLKGDEEVSENAQHKQEVVGVEGIRGQIVSLLPE